MPLNTQKKAIATRYSAESANQLPIQFNRFDHSIWRFSNVENECSECHAGRSSNGAIKFLITFDLLQRLKATKHFSPFALQLSELHPSLQLAFE